MVVRHLCWFAFSLFVDCGEGDVLVMVRLHWLLEPAGNRVVASSVR